MGISDRQTRGWHRPYEAYVYEGLHDRRRGEPTPGPLGDQSFACRAGKGSVAILPRRAPYSRRALESSTRYIYRGCQLSF
jgi:hypothetical protein